MLSPLLGLPTPQLVLTEREAPAGHRSVPVDLRLVDGLIHMGSSLNSGPFLNPEYSTAPS